LQRARLALQRLICVIFGFSNRDAIPLIGYDTEGRVV
jgi:hypothetical protein